MRQRQEVQALPRGGGSPLSAALTAEQRATIRRKREDFRRRRTGRELAALLSEVAGTFIVTIGTVVPSALDRGLDLHLGYGVRAACTGIATMIVIYALGTVSGAHTNPITTLAFAMRGDFSWRRVPGYVLAQFAGAVGAGAATLAILHPPPNSLHSPMVLGAWPAFWLEILLTAILVLINIATAHQGRFLGPQSALANGGTTIFDRWISDPISGGSMNPARTLGPALVTGGLGAWWVFAFAPLIGGAVAVALTWIVIGGPTESEAQKIGG